MSTSRVRQSRPQVVPNSGDRYTNRLYVDYLASLVGKYRCSGAEAARDGFKEHKTVELESQVRV